MDSAAIGESRAFRPATSPRRFIGSRTFSIASFITENVMPNDEMKAELRAQRQGLPLEGAGMSLEEVARRLNSSGKEYGTGIFASIPPWFSASPRRYLSRCFSDPSR